MWDRERGKVHGFERGNNEREKTSRRACECTFLLVIACYICLLANPERIVWIWSKPVGLWSEVREDWGREAAKNAIAGAADESMTRMTLEKDVVIVSCPSLWGRWLVQSCKGRTAQKLSVCALPRCATFPHRVLSGTLTSFIKRHPAHGRCAGWLRLPVLELWFVAYVEQKHDYGMAAHYSALINRIYWRLRSKPESQTLHQHLGSFARLVTGMEAYSSIATYSSLTTWYAHLISQNVHVVLPCQTAVPHQLCREVSFSLSSIRGLSRNG